MITQRRARYISSLFRRYITRRHRIPFRWIFIIYLSTEIDDADDDDAMIDRILHLAFVLD